MAGQTPGAAVGAVASPATTGESVPQQHQGEHVEDVKHFPSFEKEKGEDRCLVLSRFIGGNRVACHFNWLYDFGKKSGACAPFFETVSSKNKLSFRV